MDELKKTIEAILFSVGKYISLEEIAKLCRKDEKVVKDGLLALQTDFENNPKTPLVVLTDGDQWKLTTREEYSSITRNLISETELTKSQLETLAVIAFKYPIKQSDLIKIRTNKAYDHLMDLEKAGFITRVKFGRSKLIKLTDKFFEYFDLPHDKLKDRFKGFKELAHTIEKKEEEIEEKKEKQRELAEQAKLEEEKERKLQDGEIEIDLVDEFGDKHKLEVVDEPEEDVAPVRVVDEEKSEDSPDSGKMDEVEDTADTEEDSSEDAPKKSMDELFGSNEKEEETEEKGNEDQEESAKGDPQ